MLTLKYLLSYFTGSLVLRTWANPTESQLTLIFLLLLTAWNGVNLSALSTVIDMCWGTLWWRDEGYIPFFGPVEHRFVLFSGYVVGFVSTVFDKYIFDDVKFVNIIHSVNQVLLHFNSRGANIRPAILYLIPIAILTVTASLWAAVSPVVLVGHPRLYIFTMSLLFAYLAVWIQLNVFFTFLELYWDEVYRSGALYRASVRSLLSCITTCCHLF
jgi:hypothetical protein